MPDLLPSTGNLKLLQLEGNPWQCDCRLLHLPPLTSPPPCDELRDCPARVIALTKVFGVPDLQCHVSGWPRPQVSWWKDGNLMVPEDTKEKEQILRKPVHIFSTLRDAQPGNYTCLAGESSSSITVASKSVTGHPLILVLLVVLACTSLLLFYLWRRSHTTKEEDSGLTTSLAGLEYHRVAPGDIALGVMGPVGKGSCKRGEQTHQHPPDPAFDPRPLIRPLTFANWSQDEVPGEHQTEGGHDCWALQIQPHKLVPLQAPQWSPATNQYKSIMPDFIEALELLAGPPATPKYPGKREPPVPGPQATSDPNWVNEVIVE